MSRSTRGKNPVPVAKAAGSAALSTATSSTATRNAIKEKNDFLISLESYTPTIPEAVTKYYMQKSGVDVLDERMIKLTSLAADHFLAKTIHEAKQMSLLKQAPKIKGSKRKGGSGADKEAEDVIELEDLERALIEQGVQLRRG